MTGTSNTGESTNIRAQSAWHEAGKTARHIVSALRRKPGYILVFALALLVFGSAILLGIKPDAFGDRLDAMPDTLPLFLYASGFIIVAGTVAIVWRDERPQATGAAARATPDNPLIHDHPLSASLETTSRFIAAAMRIDSAVLKDEMRYEVDHLREKAALWERGELRCSNEQYIRVLISLYENAKTDVFATTIPEYMQTWNSPLGDRFLEAHGRSRANVVRLFIFDKLTDIKEEDLRVMRKHANQGRIEVRVYIETEDPVFKFPTDISRDFTVVDRGETIGISVSYGSDDLEAQWYFRDQNRIARFAQIERSLRAGSRSLSEIETRWREQANT